MLVKAIMAVFVVVWPMAVIVGEAFGKHPGVLAWILGSTAELVWLAIVASLWVHSRRARAVRQGKPPFYTHGTCTIQHRSPGAATRCQGTV